MAKDPAFLFYPGDWLGGTMLLSRHQKGCYIDLLMAQFNSGPLSLEHIKTVLGQDQATWTVLQAKFKLDNNGKFFNEKLATEIEKRKSYVASRGTNRSGKKPYDASYENHMNHHMENGNENRDEIKNLDKGGAGGKPILTYPFTSLDFKVLWQGWKTHLIEMKKPYQTFSSEQAALQFLADYPEKEATEIINTAIRNGWKNLIKPDKNGKYANSPNERQAGIAKLHGLAGEVLRHVEFSDDYTGPRE